MRQTLSADALFAGPAIIFVGLWWPLFVRNPRRPADAYLIERKWYRRRSL